MKRTIVALVAAFMVLGLGVGVASCTVYDHDCHVYRPTLSYTGGHAVFHTLVKCEHSKPSLFAGHVAIQYYLTGIGVAHGWANEGPVAKVDSADLPPIGDRGIHWRITRACVPFTVMRVKFWGQSTSSTGIHAPFLFWFPARKGSKTRHCEATGG